MRFCIESAPPKLHDSLEALVGHSFGVIEEPAHAARESAFACDLLKDVEVRFDGLAVGGVQSKAPVIVEEEAHRRFEFAARFVLEVRTRLGEVLEVRRRPREILPRAVHPQPLVAFVRLHHLGEAREVRELLARHLWKEVIRDAQRHLARLGQLHDCGIVLREALDTPHQRRSHSSVRID